MSSRTHRLVLAAGLLGAPFLFLACFSDHVPEAALEVDASVASVTLADDCGGSGFASREAGDCAPDVPDCGFCQQTGVRLSIEGAPTGESVPFEVLDVRMFTDDGRLVETLSPTGLSIFDGSSYVEWDQMVRPGDSLHVNVDTGAPDWAAIGGGDIWSTYGMSFHIEVRVRIDGIEETLTFSPASREPEVVT